MNWIFGRWTEQSYGRIKVLFKHWFMTSLVWLLWLQWLNWCKGKDVNLEHDNLSSSMTGTSAPKWMVRFSKKLFFFSFSIISLIKENCLRFSQPLNALKESEEFKMCQFNVWAKSNVDPYSIFEFSRQMFIFLTNIDFKFINSARKSSFILVPDVLESFLNML